MSGRAGAEPAAMTSVALRDGRSVTIREVRPEDEHAIGEFLDGLGLEARRLRFFTGAVDVGRVTHWIAEPGRNGFGLLALDGAGRIVGHAVSIELEPGRAEVAVEVADGLHGDGLGTTLIERLAELAEQRGVTTFEAQVLPENRAMLEVFRDGFDAHVVRGDGVDMVDFPTSAWRLAHDRYAQRPSGGRS